MAAITKEEIKRIYALGSAVGILQSGNKDDDLHALVSGLTGKDSISSLTSAEFKAVQKNLIERMRISNMAAPPAPRKRRREAAPAEAGMMTNEQQSLAWRLVYRLIELDAKESTATPGERMKGAVKKILQLDVELKKPFAWVSFDQGRQLIESLKRYVRSAEARSGRTGAG